MTHILSIANSPRHVSQFLSGYPASPVSTNAGVAGRHRRLITSSCITHSSLAGLATRSPLPVQQRECYNDVHFTSLHRSVVVIVVSSPVGVHKGHVKPLFLPILDMNFVDSSVRSLLSMTLIGGGRLSVLQPRHIGC